ncbi:MAG: T9SS type A sorting domain-containing protein, partial [candidate division Zixibacteria bacterium]|nr:T9SS type A sorting domain-containing protein [candidate division Zixibacteria bacterium]
SGGSSGNGVGGVFGGGGGGGGLGAGGAIFNDIDATLTMDGCVLNKNTASCGSGGGFGPTAGSTVGSASGDNGDVGDGGNGFGGAIFNRAENGVGGKITLRDVTFSPNSPTGGSGGSGNAGSDGVGEGRAVYNMTGGKVDTLRIVGITQNSNPPDLFGAFGIAQAPSYEPEIDVTPTLVEFGDTELGTRSDTRTLTISNTGNATLSVEGEGIRDTGIDVDGAAEYDVQNNFVKSVDVKNNDDPIGIPPGHRVEIDFFFQPFKAGAIRDTLILTSNDTDEDTVRVVFTGTGFRTQVLLGTFLEIAEVFVRPGDSHPKLDIRLINTGQSHVAGLQFDLDLSKVDHSELEDTAEQILYATGKPQGFEVQANLVAESTLRVVVFTTGIATLAPSTSPVILASLNYTAGQEVGVEDPIDFVRGSLKVSDPDGNLLTSFSSENGAIQIGIPGDVNRDKAIDIRDVVVLVAEILGRQGFSLPTDPRRVGFKIRNVAIESAGSPNPEVINVTDAIAIVNKLLGIENGPVGKSLAGTASLSLAAPVVLPDGRTAIPVTIEGSVVRLQAVFSFDPALLRVEKPVSAAGQDVLLDSHLQNGTLNVVALSLSAQGLPGLGAPVIYIPVTLLTEQDAVLTLGEAVLSDRLASTVRMMPGGNTSQPVGKGAAAPRAFALKGNQPNPFNPATEIRYEVPQQMHVSLIVYNLLGQEVVRLVDKVQPAGRYSVTWNARNGAGQPVSSGVYMYRLISGTGYTESKRMTLLK